MADAEHERHEVSKGADDVTLVSLATDHHVAFQDVDLGPRLNLGLGANSISLVCTCELGNN